MTEQVLFGISHLLLTVKTKHAGHQRRCSMLSPVASGCTIHSYALAPGTDSLPWNKQIGWDQSLIEGHRMVKPILQQVNLFQHLSLPKVLHSGMGSFGPENTCSVSHSMTAIQIAKHERLLVIHLPDAHLLLWIHLYGGCAASCLVNYIKMNGGCSVQTERQPVKLVFLLYNYTNTVMHVLWHCTSVLRLKLNFRIV